MATRTCARCEAERSVAGIWYLVNAEESQFVCKSCYTLRAQEGLLEGH